MPNWIMHVADFVLRGWRLMPWQDRLLAGMLLLVAGSHVCCASPPTPMFPTCPTPTTEMVVELNSGALDDAPAVEEFLGRVENLCDALEAYD